MIRTAGGAQAREELARHERWLWRLLRLREKKESERDARVPTSLPLFTQSIYVFSAIRFRWTAEIDHIRVLWAVGPNWAERHSWAALLGWDDLKCFVL